jgi:hypothetical protein
MKRRIQILIGVIIGLGLLYFLFRSADWKAVYASIRNASVGLLALALLLLTPVFFTRAQRWSYIVRSTGWVPFRPIFSASQIGFFAIFLLPARLGEIVRAVALSKLAKLPFSKCMAMVAVDRLTDLVALLVVIFVALLGYAPTGDITIAKEVFGGRNDFTFAAARIQQAEVNAIILMVVLVATLVLIYLKPAPMLSLSDRCFGVISKRLAARMRGYLEHFVDGLSIFRSASDMAKAVLFSLVTWGFYLLALVLCLVAFHVRFPWYTPFLIEVLVAAAISVPAAPGFVGQFHVAIVAGLKLTVPDVDLSQAVAIALVAHVINMIPVVLAGGFCLFWERFGFVQLTRETSKVEATLHGENSPS